jgi:hypothetical protein
MMTFLELFLFVALMLSWVWIYVLFYLIAAGDWVDPMN